MKAELTLSHLPPIQDPLDPGRCVMVVRSLVPGGAAELHGGLLPGDQLVRVEQLQVEQLSLAQAVQALKAVPPGPVHLGIRKPLVGTPAAPDPTHTCLICVCFAGGGTREEQAGGRGEGVSQHTAAARCTGNQHTYTVSGPIRGSSGRG